MPPDIVSPSAALTRQYDRVFLPLAVRGCGVGCAYCYIDGPGDEVEAFATEVVASLLDDLTDQSKAQKAIPLAVAIGCDTEALGNDRLIDSTLEALRRSQALNLPVQLATKFLLPEIIRDCLDNWPSGHYRPVVFTTITSVDSAIRVEPNAPHPRARAENFEGVTDRWLSVALIKPFLALDETERSQLEELIVNSSPSAAVVGVTYRRGGGKARDGDHPFALGWSGNRPKSDSEAFRLRLEKRGVMTFANTECVVDFFNKTGHGQAVFQNHRYLCVGCGRCYNEEKS